MKDLDSIIIHASGVEKSGKQYRTHYCTECSDPKLLELVEQGFFKGPIFHPMLRGDLAYFYLTEAGIEKAEKLHRGKK